MTKQENGGGGVGNNVRGFKVGDYFYETPSQIGKNRFYKITKIDKFDIKADDYTYERNKDTHLISDKVRKGYAGVSSWTRGDFEYKVDTNKISQYNQGDLSGYAVGGEVDKMFAGGGGVGEIKIGDKIDARWNNGMQWTSGIFKGETKNGFEVYNFSIERPKYIEYYAQISKDGYGGSKIYESKKFKDRNYKNYNFNRDENEYALGGGVGYVNQYFGKGYENDAIIELKKALPNHTFEKDKNSIIIDGGKFVIDTDSGRYGFIRAYSSEGSEGGISVQKLDEAISFIEGSNKFALGGGVGDSDDYGTFEIYKNGGSIEVNVVNSDKKYNEKEYDWILGDKDKDGVANADDTKPLDKKNSELIDTPSITTGIKSLISLKKSLDSTMFSFIDDLKNVAPDNSKIYARTKTPYSVLDKLIKKRLSTITDLIGTTIVTSDKKELDSVKKYIDSGKLGKIIELEDMYKNPKGGYRAYHYLIERNGMSIELQLKTKRQKALNELSHEPYKLGKINSALLLKITEIANRADEGDKGAINEYNEFMKQPNIENVFYAEKMVIGGSVGSEKVKEGDILISDYIDYYKLIKLGNGYFEVGKLDIFGEIKWSINIPEDFSEQSRFKKANKEELIYFYNSLNTDEDAEEMFEGGGKVKNETMDKMNKFAVGGEIGNQVTFSRYGERTTGKIIDKVRNGYEVVTNEGTILVEPQEVISFSEAPMEKKKRFGLFENGGKIDNWMNAEAGDSARVISENKMGLIIKDYGRKFHLKFVDGSEKTYDASELEFYRFEDKDEDEMFEGGGEIEGKISDLQAVINGDFPQFAKDKAKAEIERLEKQLQADSVLKKSESYHEEGKDVYGDSFYQWHNISMDGDQDIFAYSTPKGTVIYGEDSEGEKDFSTSFTTEPYYLEEAPEEDYSFNTLKESKVKAFELLKTKKLGIASKELHESKETKAEDKEEAKKPTTRKAAVKKAADKSKVVGDDLKVIKFFDLTESDWNKMALNERNKLSDSYKEKNKPAKADHKKLLAKIKAKKGDKEYDNKASLVPFTETRRNRSESSDRKREALPLGKRVSADGNTYYENRLNRADISKEDKFKTGGEIMEKNKEWNLTVRFKNGSSYSYYGDTKKEALDKYKKAFGDFKGVTNKEWELVDKFKEGGEIGENNSGWGLKFLKW